MIRPKIIRQAVISSVIFLAFLAGLVFIGPFIGLSIYEADNQSEDYSRWFHLAFLAICSYALTCFSLWAGKTFKK